MRKEIEIEGEKVYLKKDGVFGWRIIHPIKNEDGSINWKNLIAGGSWIKLGILAFVVFILVMAIQEYASNVRLLSECLEQSAWRIIT